MIRNNRIKANNFNIIIENYWKFSIKSSKPISLLSLHISLNHIQEMNTIVWIRKKYIIVKSIKKYKKKSVLLTSC